MKPTISIPKNWDCPRFTFGQRTKQGTIVGIEYYALDSCLAQRYGSGWRYTVIPDKNSEELFHYHEEQLQQLSPQELQAQIIAEIEEHQQQIKVLQQQLLAIAGGASDG
jgi:uncharacterized membrane protein